MSHSHNSHIPLSHTQHIHRSICIHSDLNYSIHIRSIAHIHQGWDIGRLSWIYYSKTIRVFVRKWVHLNFQCYKFSYYSLSYMLRHIVTFYFNRQKRPEEENNLMYDYLLQKWIISYSHCINTDILKHDHKQWDIDDH